MVRNDCVHEVDKSFIAALLAGALDLPDGDREGGNQGC